MVIGSSDYKNRSKSVVHPETEEKATMLIPPLYLFDDLNNYAGQENKWFQKYFAGEEPDFAMDEKHVIKSKLLAQGKLTEYANVEKQDNSLHKLNVELDVDKDEDLEDILSNDFWDDVDGGTYLQKK